ncbi:MAG: hypothetical protein IPF95_03385 [Flavobacteriales bacterium]|nr:hypothetical protein [Flavobacteriales bacterium]MBK7298198.1 hypothetical protein [Flavobacteriales bacterium]
MGKFVFMDFLDLKFLFISVIILAWTVYVVREARTDPPRLKAWGYRTDNLRASIKTLLPFALVSLVACIGIGAYNGTLNVS